MECGAPVQTIKKSRICHIILKKHLYASTDELPWMQSVHVLQNYDPLTKQTPIYTSDGSSLMADLSKYPQSGVLFNRV